MSEPNPEPSSEPNPEPNSEPTSATPDRSPGEVAGAGEQGSGADAFADVAALKYEDARDELVAIVARLEAGQAPLEDSMHLWRRGEALAAHCARWLDGAQAEIEAGTRA